MARTPALRKLLTGEQIARRIHALAREIERDLPAGETVHLIAVLKGAFMFLADLARALNVPVTLDFVALSSYGAATTSSGEVRLLKDLDVGIAERHVVLVEDILDTGLTLSYLIEVLRARQPKTLRSACLFDKPARRRVEVKVDYVGFTLEDRFVVGYGLDWNEHYRHLPYLAVIDSAG